METYEKLVLDVVLFEKDDVIVSSPAAGSPWLTNGIDTGLIEEEM